LGFLAARPARQGAARKTLEGVFDVIVLTVFICLFLQETASAICKTQHGLDFFWAASPEREL
jgi:hypothetical protein